MIFNNKHYTVFQISIHGIAMVQFMYYMYRYDIDLIVENNNMALVYECIPL